MESGRKSQMEYIKCYLSNFRNVKMICAFCMGTGRAFPRSGAAIGKALNPDLVFLNGEHKIHLNL